MNTTNLTPEPGWTIAYDGALIVAIRVLRSVLDAEALRTRTLDWISRQRQPELSDIRIVRSPCDFDPHMRRFVRAFLAKRIAAA